MDNHEPTPAKGESGFTLAFNIVAQHNGAEVYIEAPNFQQRLKLADYILETVAELDALKKENERLNAELDDLTEKYCKNVPVEILTKELEAEGIDVEGCKKRILEKIDELRRTP